MKIKTVRVDGAGGGAKIRATGGGRQVTVPYPLHVGDWGGCGKYRYAARALADVFGYPVETVLACDGELGRGKAFGFRFTVVDYGVCWKCVRVLNVPDVGFDDATPYRLQAGNFDDVRSGPDLVLCRVCTDDPRVYERACTAARVWWSYA